MDCDKAQKKILLDGVSDTKVEDHVRRCAACALFADSLDRFSHAKPDDDSFEVPRSLDDSVKGEARDFLAERQQRRSAVQNIQYGDFASYFAMAATIALVAWLFVSLLSPKEDFDAEGDVVRMNRDCSRSHSSGLVVSLAWNDECVEDDFLSIETDIEFTFALMNVSSDDDSGCDLGGDSNEDARFNVFIPDILT